MYALNINVDSMIIKRILAGMGGPSTSGIPMGLVRKSTIKNSCTIALEKPAKMANAGGNSNARPAQMHPIDHINIPTMKLMCEANADHIVKSLCDRSVANRLEAAAGTHNVRQPSKKTRPGIDIAEAAMRAYCSVLDILNF